MLLTFYIRILVTTNELLTCRTAHDQAGLVDVGPGHREPLEGGGPQPRVVHQELALLLLKRLSFVELRYRRHLRRIVGLLARRGPGGRRSRPDPVVHRPPVRHQRPLHHPGVRGRRRRRRRRRQAPRKCDVSLGVLVVELSELRRR